MLEKYKKELEKLNKESKDKDPSWEGWNRMDILGEIIAKYNLFDKIS